MTELKRRTTKRPLLIASVVGIAVAVAAIWSIYQPAPQTPQSAAVTVDQADVAKYWADNYSGASWYSLTGTPSWDGATLVARTKLYADNDAREPALSICRAMVMYWLTADKELRPVRVLDQADAILTSAHTASDPCAWRR